MSKIRQQRTAEQIRYIMVELFQRHLNDPRLRDVTITQVLIDRELQHANIYVNALGDESRRKEVMQGLQKAQSFLRRQLAKRMQVRSVPELHFRWDPSLLYAQEVDQILAELDIPPESQDIAEEE